MPKTRAKSGPEKSGTAPAKPYARDAPPRATRASSQTASSSKSAPAPAPATTHTKPLADIDAVNKMSTTTKHDRRKRRRSSKHAARNNEAAETVESDGEPHGVPNGHVHARSSPTPGPSIQSPTKKTRESRVEVHVPRGHPLPATLPDAQKELDRERSEHKDTRRNLREAMHSLRKQADRAEKADHAEKALREQLVQLQKELEEQKQKVFKQTEDLETKTKVATASKHHDNIMEGLQCSVCMEVYNDPHVLSCGHAACLECLVKWFRSGNAYRGADIEVVSELDDLTYRTKLCLTCRDPVIRRPIRMFAVRSVIESLGLGPRSAIGERNDDPWALTFPPDPQSYLISDEKDGVDRCPLCGCEVALGRCEGCDTMFSDEDVDFDEDMDDDMSIGSAMGEEADFMAALRRHGDIRMRGLSPFSISDSSDYDSDYGPLAEPDPFNRRHPHHYHPNFDLIDDMADMTEEEEEWSGSEDNWGDRAPPEYRSGSEPLSENGRRSPEVDGPIDAEEVDELDIDRPREANRRRQLPRLLSPSVDSDYESSFIDDEEPNDWEPEAEPEAEGAAGSAAGSPEPQGDAPDIDQLRNLRAARFGRAPPRDASPIPHRPGRRGRQVIVVSDDDE